MTNVTLQHDYLASCDLHEQETSPPTHLIRLPIRRVCIDDYENIIYEFYASADDHLPTRKRILLRRPYKVLRVYIGKRTLPCKLRIYPNGKTEPWAPLPRYNQSPRLAREYQFRKWLYPILDYLLAIAQPGVK